MTGKRRDDREALERLAAAIADDLLSEKEAELVADLLQEGLNPTEEADAMRALIERAARESGKRRFKAAKDALLGEKSAAPTNVVRPDIAEARQKLATILKQQPASSGLSIAARKQSVSELSDSDVFSMLEDLEALGIGQKLDKPGSDS